MCSTCIQCLFLFICVFSVSSSDSFPHSEGNNCNKFISSGFNYAHFFEVSELKSINSHGFTLHFRVKSPSDARIKFSETPFPKEDEPAYEVVLGAEKNAISFIRRQEKEFPEISLETKDILSADEARGFWIWISDLGRINVGKEGEDIPFMSWEDNDPLEIDYFSFSSWNDITSEWVFNCDSHKAFHPGYEDEDLTSYLERRLQFSPVNKQTIGTDTSNFNVSTHLCCNYIYLDDGRGTLTIHGIMSQRWEDRRVAWSPEKFKKEYVDWTPFEIWFPNFVTRNKADTSWRIRRKMAFAIRIYHNGTIHWKYPVHFSTLCQGIDHHYWPKDSHICEIELGLHPPLSSVKMTPSMSGIQLQGSRTSFGWKITKFYATTRSLLESVNKKMDILSTPPSDHIVFHFTLTRFHNTYSSALIITLAAISIMVLSSFWASPLGTVKISLQCISFMMTSLCLLFCWKMIPVLVYGSLPAMLSAFIVTMLLVWFAIVSTVITSSLIFSPPARMHSSVRSFLKSKFLAIIFCLPQRSTKVAACYQQITGHGSTCKEDLNGHSIVPAESDVHWNWILISAITDRIFFWVYAGLFSYLISICINSC